MNQDNPDSHPQRAKGFKATLGRLYLKIFGWSIEGQPPHADAYVIIAAPHTSNWDLIYLLAYAYHFGIKISWMGKDTLFRFPFGGFMRWLGGVAVNRSSPQNTVQQMIDAFTHNPGLVLAVPPEGTRSKRSYWKTGFYFIAHGAGVPIATSFLDYGRKRGGFGPPLLPTGDIHADMDILRGFYSQMRGKFPENTNDVRLRSDESP